MQETHQPIIYCTHFLKAVNQARKDNAVKIEFSPLFKEISMTERPHYHIARFPAHLSIKS